MTILARRTIDGPRAVRGEGAPRASERVRVDGKFLAVGSRRFRIQGVTYGPFAINSEGEPFPAIEDARNDFSGMKAAGINCLRTYHLPPEWLFCLAEEEGLKVFVDVPWSKHLCFAESLAAQREAREAVKRAAERGRAFSSTLAYSVGNEIPADVVRWHGARRVERFLAELYDVARQADPNGLVTYASYPPTEYLDLSFFDVTTFNVYLHDREAFRRYLLRLQNIVGERPLVLGEIGMDALRNGEAQQADFVSGHTRAAFLSGLAGAFIFSWTDDWFTGGDHVGNWSFGLTWRDRSPKAAYHAVREVFESGTAMLLDARPCVSVIVCTYNGGRTLEQCLTSLLALDYPNYEVIVVDDGSTDDTESILARFPEVRAIRQPNRGLSAARNEGLRAARGEVVAYTDSDCFADPDWLTQLTAQLAHSGAVAVGGPNLSPEDGWLAACVAASPGQPTHVLESDQVAEHIPGCNMAFRRAALAGINGFDSQYRKAGDDVDVCWRLQQAGYWITFAPGAFVWHHRRQTPRTYLRQQAGYGEAEALLRFKHPDKFNGWGDGKWRGVMYGASLGSFRFGKSIIYHGIFGTGLFQTIYRPCPAHWAMIPSTLEWHAVAGALALASILRPGAALGLAAMLSLSVLVAVLQAAQARIAARHDNLRSRFLVAVLSYFQPLVRSWARYRTRFLAYGPSKTAALMAAAPGEPIPISGTCTMSYWTESGRDRTELLTRMISQLNEQGWGKTIDSGWSDWDLEIGCHLGTVVRVKTTQEDHGGGKRLIRVRCGLRASGFFRALLGAVALGIFGAILERAWPAAAFAAALGALCAGIWWRGARRATAVVDMLDEVSRALGLIRLAAVAARAPVSTGEATGPVSSVGSDVVHAI